MQSYSKEILKRIVLRIDGDRDERFNEYINLAREGIGGFIIFGGEIEKIRSLISELLSIKNLIISSDLESGVGYQLRGGVRFPSQMAFGMAYMNDPSCIKIIRDAYDVMSDEVLYSGINTVYAPVLDLDTNPENHIISIRAYGSEPAVSARLGRLMVNVFNRKGIKLCAKHFIGHGDTSMDSHHTLPYFEKSLESMLENEMVPFREVINAGIPAIMMAHVVVRSIDPHMPASISRRVVSFLRESGFHGVLFTDALNMSALKNYGEVMAARFALQAGIDFLLHPVNLSEVLEGLRDLNMDNSRIEVFMDSLRGIKMVEERPDPVYSLKLVKEIQKRALRISGEPGEIKEPFLVILNDEKNMKRGEILTENLGIKKRTLKVWEMEDIRYIPPDSDIIVSVFSRPSAFKKDRRGEIRSILSQLKERTRFFISMGDPHIFHGIQGPILYAYDDSAIAEEMVVQFLLDNGIIRHYSI